VIPPPPSPALEKPETGEKTIQLRWRPHEKIKKFHFQMARDREFKEVLIDERVDGTDIVVPKPEIPGFYYVRTSSIDPKGYEGEFSIPQSLEIKPPPPPILQVPDTGPTSVRIRWSPVAEGMNYRLQMAGDEQFQSILIDQKTGQPGVVLKRPAPGTYYVRVSSINSKGYEGEFSKPRDFEIKPPPPPGLQVPDIGLTGVQIRWPAVAEGMSYRLQMAGDDQFQMVLIDQKTDQLEIVLKRPTPGKYYVRASSIDSEGYQGDFSKLQSFEIKPPPPPRLEKPEVDKKTIHLRWSPSEEGLSYHLQLARDNTFKAILEDQRVRTTGMSLKRPDAPGIYYVRVSGIDADGNEGEFSTPEKIEIKEEFPYTVFGVGAGILATIGLILLLGL
jgi:hypothetical protein